MMSTQAQSTTKIHPSLPHAKVMRSYQLAFEHLSKTESRDQPKDKKVGKRAKNAPNTNNSYKSLGTLSFQS